jgi:hypothetical protein
MKFAYTLLLVMNTLLVLAQNDRPEREAFKLQLAVNNEQYYGMDVQKGSFFVKEKILQIYPGEKLNIECEIKGDEIITMKVVKDVIAKNRTITLSFEQQTLNNGSKQMLLVVNNPFDKQLKYQAMMYTPAGQQWTPTSIIPILPKINSYESWPHPIITLVLTDWQLTN